MATSVQDRKITAAEVKAELKKFLPFSVQKIGENLFDLIITITFAGIAISVPATMQSIPVTYGEMTAYITIIFVLLVVRRVIHDFDDAYTVDEIGDALADLNELAKEIHHIVKSESMLSEDEYNERLQAS